MRYRVATATVAVLGLVITSVAIAQNRPQPTRPKPQPPRTNPTLGTAQLPGDNGKVGTTYQLGAKGQELHFILNSAVVAQRFPVKDATHVAKKEQRLLILTCTAHNPQKTEMNLSWNSFTFTAVSPSDKNSGAYPTIYDVDTRAPLTTQLKPAQKTRFIVVIPIWSQGPINKVMVERGNAPVLRYDLEASIPPLVSKFSADKKNLDEEARASTGELIDIGSYDIKVESVEAVDAVGAYKSSSSQQIYVMTVEFANPTNRPLRILWNAIRPTLFDENGEKISWKSDMITMGSGKTIDQEIEPKESIRARYVFSGPAGLNPKRVRLQSSESDRTVVVTFN